MKEGTQQPYSTSAIVNKSDVVERAISLLKQMLTIGCELLEANEHPDYRTVISLMNNRARIFEAFRQLHDEATGTPEDEGFNSGEPISAVQSPAVRAAVADVVEQNAKLEVLLKCQRDQLGQLVRTSTNTVKFKRVFTGREYMNQLPRGLKVDKSL